MDNEIIRSNRFDIEINKSYLNCKDASSSQTWTINFDLDTQNPCYDYNHYETIHNFLKENDFTYRQHSGDISVCEMDIEQVIDTLDDLYEAHPDIKECTKSCLFTSVNSAYSFTDIREEQKSTEPSKSDFDMSLKIKKADAKDVFKTTNPELIESKIRNFFEYPSGLKEQMSYQIAEEADDVISIKWESGMPISSLDKTIATNRIFAKYDKLLESDRGILLEMDYDGQTTNLIEEQQRIEFEENKRLVEYDMSTKILGKQEYDNRNEVLKRRLNHFGFEHVQESGWISKKGMTDEQVQAVLTEVFRENCNYDKITEVMDVSVVNEIYDYGKIRDECNSTDSESPPDGTGGGVNAEVSIQTETVDTKNTNNLFNRFSNSRMRQVFGNTVQCDVESHDDFDFK